MADIEAAARAQPRAPPLPPPAPRRPAAAEVKAAVDDAVIYSFVGAMFAGSAASIALVVARYAVGVGSSSSAYAVVAFARDVFLRALAAELLLCPFTIVLLLLRLDRRPPEPPEELVVVSDSNRFPSPPISRSSDSQQAFLSVGHANFMGVFAACSRRLGTCTPPCSYMVQSTLERAAGVGALAMASYRC
ncbi:unnamed protein product [Urochloa humidicola]